VPPLAAEPRRGERFRSLDAWRGICALFVAALHFETVGWIHSSSLVQNAGRFVDFFFVLSGFVIAHAYGRRLQKGAVADFLIRRVGRLWPLHLATLAATIAMGLAGALLGLTVRGWEYETLPAQVTMTHAWGFLNRLTWNGPSWSISTEMFAYALFALLAWRLPGRWLDVACAATLALALWILLAVAPDGMSSTVDFGIARCLFGFMAGALASRVWESGGLRPRGEPVAALLAFAAVAFLPWGAEPLVVPIFVWVVLVFASDNGVVSRQLQRPFPQLLGRVSYSIYMTHYIVGLTFMTVLVLFTSLSAEIDGSATVVASWWICDALSLIELAAVVALSCLTYAWIERPGRAWFNRRSEPVPAAW
jgi:peptidoglycan/LPS O-acetylase OafA/YrhL